MTLTIEQRHDAYKHALGVAIREDGFTLGSCIELMEWVELNFDRDFYNKADISLFPEFLAKKPFGIHDSCSWWPVGSPLRIKALQECVEETKPKIQVV